MIKAEKLCKTFGEIKAVNEVSLTITDNSIFGLAGTNGAGKSTLMNSISGAITHKGSIMVDGRCAQTGQRKDSGRRTGSI